ncbi:hypothetical protein N431DRAFT_52001 [Stipitochalara longipes BDJ]|nr:hypothetical protein N431DRAFT_52001 [Stipitochalara longipes BDJ]
MRSIIETGPGDYTVYPGPGAGRDWNRRTDRWRGRNCRQVGDLEICLVRSGALWCSVVMCEVRCGEGKFSAGGTLSLAESEDCDVLPKLRRTTKRRTCAARYSQVFRLRTEQVSTESQVSQLFPLQQFRQATRNIHHRETHAPAQSKQRAKDAWERCSVYCGA